MLSMTFKSAGVIRAEGFAAIGKVIDWALKCVSG